VRDDGECSFKSSLQAFLGSFFGVDISLQKRGVSVFLLLQQVQLAEYPGPVAHT
jgi:hypothetical protein